MAGVVTIDIKGVAMESYDAYDCSVRTTDVQGIVLCCFNSNTVFSVWLYI